jgi:hypothetical protein
LTQNKKCPNGAVGEDAQYKSKSYTHAHSPRSAALALLLWESELAAPVERSEITLLLKTTAINYKSGARAERALTAAAGLL